MKKLIKMLVLVVGFSGLSHAAEIIKTLETISIDIKGVPAAEQGKITGSYGVDSKGLVYLPMITSGIKVSGLSSSSAARKIEAVYRSAEIYTNPRVNIATARDAIQQRTLEEKQVHMIGDVNRKGAIPYKENMTLEQVIAAAGGITDFGTVKRVVLTRGNKRYTYDLRKVANKNIKLKPGDTITVPRARLFEGSGL